MRAIISRNIDSLGRIVLPKELRVKAGIEEGTPMDIFLSDDGCIVLKKSIECCVFCGKTQELRVFNGKKVCGVCLEYCRGELCSPANANLCGMA